MSGSAFLEEVVNWDVEKRAERVEEALPRLIICFENKNTNEEAVGILQLVCQSFVPVVQPDQLEEKVFSKISQQVCGLLDTVIEDLHDVVTQDQQTDCQHLLSLLQHIASVLQCVEQCMKHIIAVADLHISQVRSLMTCAFHVLKGSYTHCQESSSLYGDSLPALSDALSVIFRAAHSLQMVLLNMLDKLTTTPRPDCQQDIMDIADVVACLDLKLTISLWKALSKLAGQQIGVLHPHLDLTGMLSYLCEEIHTGVTQLMQSAPPAALQEELTLSQGDEKVFLKSLRILSFQMKVLVAMVRDFHDYLAECVTSLYKLLLYLISIVPPSRTAVRLQEKHQQEVQQQLCSAVQPLTSHLLTNPTFITCLLDPPDAGQEKDITVLLLQVAVMEGVAKASGHVEACLPVYIPVPPFEGQPDRTISVYQYVVEHACSFIASCPSRLFHIIERTLLQAVLDRKPLVSLAAADCWCFLARYGTAELCWQHTQQLLSLLQHVHSLAPGCQTARPLTSLLRRLVKFLTPQYQKNLVSQLPAASHLWLWREVGVGVLSPAVADEACQSLVPACLDTLQDVCQSPAPCVLQAATVIPAMQCLHSVLQHNTTHRHLTPQQGAQLIHLLSSLWRMIPPDLMLEEQDTGLSEVRRIFLSSLVTLTSDLVEQMEVKLLLKVLVFLHRAMLGCASREVAAACLCLLQSLGPLRLPPSVEQGQILRKVSELFAAVLTHNTACVQHAALEAFTRFAEQTAHEAVVPECLSLSPGLQDKVAAFVQKAPLPAGNQFDTVSYLESQQQTFSAHLQSATVMVESKNLQPNSKRRRTDDPDDLRRLDVNETSADGVIEDLRTVTHRMEVLQGDGTLPQWLVDKAKPLLQRLSSCLHQQ